MIININPELTKITCGIEKIMGCSGKFADGIEFLSMSPEAQKINEIIDYINKQVENKA